MAEIPTEEHGAGTKHNQLTGGTVVYTKLQCDLELEKRQKKLTAGDGISLDPDGTISLAKLPVQEVNVLQTCHDLSESPGNVLTFDQNSKLYEVVHYGPTDVSYKLAGCLDNLDDGVMAEVILLVTLHDPMAKVEFTADLPITIVGDDDFSVTEGLSTMWFAIRSFRGRIILSKLGTF